jgi:hypothetical protein
VATGSFRQGYAALIAAMESRAQLQQMLGRNLAGKITIWLFNIAMENHNF